MANERVVEGKKRDRRKGTSLPKSAGAHGLVEGVIVNRGKISGVAVTLLYEGNDKGGKVVVS